MRTIYKHRGVRVLQPKYEIYGRGDINKFHGIIRFLVNDLEIDFSAVSQ